MTPIGWVIHFGDGTTASSRAAIWATAPAHDVQAVVVYFAETYQCWHGPRLTGAFETHNYKTVFHGATQAIDYYWMLPDGTVGAGDVKEIPPLAVVKEGSWTGDANFMRIVNDATQERRWLPTP